MDPQRGRRSFTGTDGVPLTNVHFVRKRHDKHAVCERLGITYFVDDRLDVHRHLTTVDHRYLFTGGLGSENAPTDIPDGVIAVDSWSELVGILRENVAGA